jgi:hypothetical protein
MVVTGAAGAALGFFGGAYSRAAAEGFNNSLTQGGRMHPCTASSETRGVCVEINRLNESADYSIGIGVAALFFCGFGVTFSSVLLYATRSPSKAPIPQVALTKVPGGGVLTVTGTF